MMASDPDKETPGAATTPGATMPLEPPSGAARNQREHRGSWSNDDPDRPLWDGSTCVVHEYAYQHEDGREAFRVIKGKRGDGQKVFLTGRRFAGSLSDLDMARRDDPKGFFKWDGLTTYEKGRGDEPLLLYRLPELLAEMAARPDDPVFICEGEKDADTLRERDLIATTNPNGALKWEPAFNRHFRDRHVVIPVDKDGNGRKRINKVLPGLRRYARSIKVLELPDLDENGDVTDWLEAGRTTEELLAEVEKAAVHGPASGAAQNAPSQAEGGDGVRLTDFYAFMPAHNYIFAPSREAWPATSVNSRIPPVPLEHEDGTPVVNDDGEQVFLPANKWLDQHRPVEQMTWAPGEPLVIKDRLISEGGWIHRTGCNVFNQYRPPAAILGDPEQAAPWVDHVKAVYADEAEHIINWLAHRIQRPEEKINHALVFGGVPGIGKDTILHPVKEGVGHWNFAEVSPKHLLGRFNSFVKSVILRISEARDLGDVDRFAFYDHMKTYTAAPPDVLRVDEKNLREYSAFNVCGVIITTNYKTDGIYLPEDDRRHFVAWSERTMADFNEAYWSRLWDWYENGGIGHVVAFLAQRDLSGFHAKAPPPKTPAFWDIVSANRAPEEDELAEALAKLGNPDAVTLGMIADAAETSFAD
ncbi:MAG: DUF5906 domain-containing protein, partial [Pseudomonadota bacterium]